MPKTSLIGDEKVRDCSEWTNNECLYAV